MPQPDTEITPETTVPTEPEPVQPAAEEPVVDIPETSPPENAAPKQPPPPATWEPIWKPSEWPPRQETPQQETPQSAPVAVHQGFKPKSWIVLSSLAALAALALIGLIGLQHMYMMRQMASISGTQTRLEDHYTETAKIATAADTAAGEAIKKVTEVDNSTRDATLALAATMADSTTRMERATTGINRELKRINVRIDALETRTKPETPRMGVFDPPSSLPAPPPLVHPATTKPVRNDQHKHETDTGAIPPPGTVVLNGHWILLNTETHKDAEVIPYAHNTSGTTVHDLDDGHDYLINNHGGWIGKATQ